jgi:hypothetical protein
MNRSGFFGGDFSIDRPTTFAEFTGRLVTIQHKYRLAPNGVATDTGYLDTSEDGSRLELELHTEEVVLIDPANVIEIKEV